MRCQAAVAGGALEDPAAHMLTLRCTQKLRARLRLPDPLPEPPPSNGALGDWYVSLFEMESDQIILATSQASLLTVLLPATRLRAKLSQTLHSALGELLGSLGVPRAVLARELATMEPVIFGPARDRRVLSSMSQMASETAILRGRGNDLHAIALTLCYVPRSVLGRKAGDMRTPLELLGELLVLPTIQAAPLP
jgi:hypothetical protein